MIWQFWSDPIGWYVDSLTWWYSGPLWWVTANLVYWPLVFLRAWLRDRWDLRQKQRRKAKGLPPKPRKVYSGDADAVYAERRRIAREEAHEVRQRALAK